MKADPSPRSAVQALVAWYRANRRDLPWRRTRDPWAILVSELMLQQTRVETVIPYYERFLAAFPTPKALARAPQEKVLKAWEGLGYYARARNLHAAAKRICEIHGGRLPDTLEAIRALPGVGPYTAGAVLSIAFGKRVPVLDGNVVRVLSRYLAVREDPAVARTRALLWKEAARWAGAARDPGEANQGLMELGAAVCVPGRPLCLLCPLREGCRGRTLGIAASLPASARKAPPPVREGHALVLRRQGRILAARRGADGLLGGLWGFPQSLDGKPLAVLARAWGAAPKSLRPLGTVRHLFTHIDLRLSVWEGEPGARKAPAGRTPARWVDPEGLGRLPLSKLDAKIAALAFGAAPAKEGPGAQGPAFPFAAGASR